MPSPPSYGCCTRVNFVLKKHLLFQMNLSNSGLKNRSIKEYWLIFTVLKFPLGLQFSHNLTKFKIIKYISTIYIMTTTCTYLQQLTQVSDVAHGPLVLRLPALFFPLPSPDIFFWHCFMFANTVWFPLNTPDISRRDIVFKFASSLCWSLRTL